jgi:hypothetical protein
MSEYLPVQKCQVPPFEPALTGIAGRRMPHDALIIREIGDF